MVYADRDFAVIVLVQSAQGVPLVRDPSKPAPRYWKLPGGKGEEGDTVEQAGWRELREETGVELSIESLKVVLKKDRRTHDLYVVVATIDQLPSVAEQGVEGEEIGVFHSLEEITQLSDFFPPHHSLLQELKLV